MDKIEAIIEKRNQPLPDFELTMTNITIYGIPNCDLVKKTFTWFNKNELAVQFHDYKKRVSTKQTLIAG